MRLISGFTDYYDGALKYFAEDKVNTYVRNREEIRNFARPLDYSRDYTSNHYKWPTNLHRIMRVIGFCGKIYPVLIVEYVVPDNENPYFNKTVIEYCYTPEEAIESELRAVERDKNTRVYNPTKHSDWDGIWKDLSNRKDYLEVFQLHKTPCFAVDYLDWSPDYPSSWALIINPTLKDYKFQKVFDAYIAMQELEMFIGNALVQDTQVKVPVGSDEIIAQSKGFDKYSFRKSPSKK